MANVNQTISDQKKQKAKLPSGLVSNWQLKLFAPILTSSKATKATVADSGGSPSGSLKDEDTFANHLETLAVGHLSSCGNVVCYHDASSLCF